MDKTSPVKNSYYSPLFHYKCHVFNFFCILIKKMIKFSVLPLFNILFLNFLINEFKIKNEKT